MRASLRIGCAVGRDHVHAVALGRGGLSGRVAVPEDGGTLYERIAHAFNAALTAIIGSGPTARRARVRIAILPPLAQVRSVSLPRMRPEESARVLTRAADRYFFGVREPQIATAEGSRFMDGKVLAAAAPAGLIDELRSAVPEGVTIDLITTAVAAWCAAPGESLEVAAVIDDVGYTIRRRGRRPLAMRRLRPPHSPSRMPYEHALVCAAANAWRSESHAFLTAEDREVRRRRHLRRIRIGMAAALIGVTSSAAGYHTWLGHELEAVRAERAALQGVLGPTMAAMDSLQRLEERLTILEDARDGIRWSDAVPMIAQRLHTDAHLIRFTGSGDSVAFRVNAGAAADALPSLRSAPQFRDVRIVGAIQREPDGDAAATERFDVAARITQSQVRR